MRSRTFKLILVAVITIPSLVIIVLAVCKAPNPHNLMAQTGTVSGIVSGALQKWHKVEIKFPGPSTAESANNPNPFLDYRLDVVFTSPSNIATVVPGFYAGDGNGGGSGNVWMVRFNPDEAGDWTYR